MDAISQTTFSYAFSWMKMFEYRLKFHWSLFLRVQLTISQHWFRWWLGSDQATSHYLDQWWLDYRRIYASLGLSELKNLLYIVVYQTTVESQNKSFTHKQQQQQVLYLKILYWYAEWNGPTQYMCLIDMLTNIHCVVSGLIWSQSKPQQLYTLFTLWWVLFWLYNDLFTYILQGYFTGTGAIIRLPQCQWSNLEKYC